MLSHFEPIPNDRYKDYELFNNKIKMKTVNWVIDKYMFEDYEDRLVEAIEKSGAKVHFYDDMEETSIQNFFNKKFTDDDIVIFHGSLQHGRRVLNSTKQYPGIYLTLENYECYRYYGYYGDHLLNSNYLMMGLNDVLRKKEKIFGIFQTDYIFIRPSDGYKSFPGQTLSYENFDDEFDTLIKSYGGLDIYKLCVISPAVEINKEYRFIVVDGKVISGSLYMDNNNRKDWKAYYDKECYDGLAWKFAEEMSKIYQPDRAFTLDVCKLSNGEYKLIEINSFCCASMYGNNYDNVVKAINNLCITDFFDIFT